MPARQFARKGDLSSLRLNEVAKPRFGQREVLAAVKAAGVNPSDINNVQAWFPYTTRPRLPGRHFAGIAEKAPSLSPPEPANGCSGTASPPIGT